MTSFSTYASRFLASGASAEPIHAPPTSSTAFKSSLYHPFNARSADGAEQRSVYCKDSHASDDTLGLENVDEEEESRAFQDTSRRRQQLPHLQRRHAREATSSRLLSHFRPHDHHELGEGMAEIKDEVEVEEDGMDRGHRTNISVPGAGSSMLSDEHRTPEASAAFRDDHDPFLAEDDLQRTTRSRSTSPKAHFRGPSAEAKARGWMVHGVESNSPASAVARLKRHALPDDIYRDPDDDSSTDGAMQRSSPRYTASSSQDSSSDETDDDDDDDDVPRRRRTGRHEARQNKISEAAGSIGSSLREPLLSSAGSERLSQQPPGAFHGITSRTAAADVYAYPHPPAKSGWTPWAPGNRVPLRQYKDKGAFVSWIATLVATLLVAGWMAIRAKTFTPPSSPSTRPSPYFSLTRSVPVLFLLTFLSIAAATANLVFLRNLSRVGGAHILRSALIGVPMVLGLGWVWAFAGSFIYDDERWSGGGWSTTGLRILSILPLAAAIYFAQTIWARRNALHRSLSVLELSASVVASHPSLLLLSLAILIGFLCITAPFLSIFMRLFLRGHMGGPGSRKGNSEWHTDGNARSMAWLTIIVWLWTWLVLRGIQRVTVAGVVSHWYFHRDSQGQPVFDVHEDDAEADESLPGPAPGQWLGEDQAHRITPTHMEIVRASFVRATGPALGTICLSALVLSLARVGTTMAASARWAHRKLSRMSRIPVMLRPITHGVALLAGISALLQGLSDYALIYVGVTGEGFTAAARRSSRLVTRQKAKSVMEGLVINVLLDLTTLALCFLTGVAGFLFSAHNLHVPADAPLVGLLCALLPYWTLRLCADVLTNATDTLYLCFAIDEASGEKHCQEVADAFTKNEERLPF